MSDVGKMPEVAFLWQTLIEGLQTAKGDFLIDHHRLLPQIRVVRVKMRDA